ncbi:MAG: hypothetical protein KBG28_05030 [Kofleriaceae bacterium]|nr:hypothetical protein [Kofleriaceae bacterium]
MSGRRDFAPFVGWIAALTITLVAGLACSGGASRPVGPSRLGTGAGSAGSAAGGGSGAGAGSGSGHGDAPPAGDDGPPGTPLLAAGGVACATPTCAYHPGAGGYYRCLSGGAGACFHFGAPCQPAGDCWIDPADGAYKRCAEARDGQCRRYGAACPAPACRFDRRDGLHRRCLDERGATCARWGELCAP